MLYKITGVGEHDARQMMAKALPILAKHGAPTEVNTCELSDAIVTGPNGEEPGDFDNITFGFPAFKALRDSGHLASITEELAHALGCPCYTLDAPVFAGFA